MAKVSKIRDKSEIDNQIDNELISENKALAELANYILEANKNGDYWILLDDDRIIFNLKLVAIFPNIFSRKIKIEQSSIRKYVRSKVIQNYGEYLGFSLMTIDECANGFFTEHLDKSYYRKQGFDITEYIVVKNNENNALLFDGKNTKEFSTNNQQKNTMYIPMHYIDRKLSLNWDAMKVAMEIVRNGLVPKIEIFHFQDLNSLIMEYKAGGREIESNGKVKRKEISIGDSDTKTEEKLESVKTNIEKEGIHEDNIVHENPSLTYVIENQKKEKKLLECDKIKFSFMTYDKDRLFDLANGHWDIYDEVEAKGKMTYKNKDGYVARNPMIDVQKNGVVAIDFGTKSTVVVCKNGSTLKIPLRIGTNNFKKEVSDDQYENPTVEEFINLKEFMKNYEESAGRPNTKWEDLIIANVAQKDKMDNSSVLEKYYSYFSDIKQWAAGQTEAIISDQNGYMPKITQYLKDESEVDLVEIYAYFIGLHINNMQNGIFLNYRLSFPVSFDVNVREKIRGSFERGIKKTIPDIVQKSDLFIKKYKVRLVASEPACYAACAIQQYKINVLKNQAIFYGVFDFGGGTSDFDFGLWKECDDDDSSYSYELNRITSVGDPYLGGENLLELLAYEVFKNNLDILKENEISIIRPVFCERFRGDEFIVSEPQTRIARRNADIVKEKLRTFWEGSYEEAKAQSNDKDTTIEVDLMSRNGENKNSIQLIVDYKKMFNILSERIRKGIQQFENGRRRAIAQLTNFQKKYVIQKTQYIFLAGNSCKSTIVMSIFNEIYKKEIENEEIKIFYPLQCKGEKENDQLFKPNGKTGVAWGLLDIGDSVKFNDNDLALQEKIEFKYCIGINKRNILIPKVTPNKEYGKWIKIVRADKEEVTIYFTDNISAADSNFTIEDTNNFIYVVDNPEEDRFVYIRMVDSTSIEITDAKDEDIYIYENKDCVFGTDIKQNSSACKIEFVDLKQKK